MNDAEIMKEYIARAKSLALNVQYHDIEVSEQEISRRFLNGLPPSYAPEKRNFALKTYFTLAELESGLVRVVELNRSSNGTDGSHVLAAGFKARSGERSGGRGGHNGSGRGKHDGKDRPPNQRQPQHQPRYQREQQPAHQSQHQQCQPRHQREQQPAHLFFFLFSFISLIADGPHYHPACGHKGSSHLSPVHALQFAIAMQVQHSYNSSTNG